jgi:hypothetical protein
MGLKFSLAPCTHTCAQDLFWPNRPLGWAVTMLYDDLVVPHGGVGVELMDDEAGAAVVPGVGEADHIRRLRRGHDGLRRGGGRHRQHAMAWRCSSVTGSQPGRRGDGDEDLRKSHLRLSPSPTSPARRQARHREQLRTAKERQQAGARKRAKLTFHPLNLSSK